MAVIKIMDDLLANKIAAGEVVERCASVVKELVENSIDASSTEIKIELIEAGTKEIKVTDNGIGMEEEDAIMSFSRHATSKLKNEEDLFHINTLGFRGEALASIASVSDVYLETSTGDVGTSVHIKGGKIIDVKKCEARKGTIFTIKNLFFNTPARLKHLKSLYTELSSITDYINRIALSHPQIKFTLINNNNLILRTDGSDNLLKTIKDIYGLEVAKKMIEVNDSNDDYDMCGYISYPEVTRSNRNYITTIVNGRVVRNAELNRVINDAYHTYKPDNRYPIVVLKFEVDASLVDVNIHPTKMDIKFSKFDELCILVEKTIKGKLGQINLIPTVNQKPTPKPNYEEITLDLERVVKEETPYKVNPYTKIETPIVVNDDLNEDMTEEKEEKQVLKELYPIGLLLGTYIVCQNELGMYLIDQHAAKERINYEHYSYKLSHPSNETMSMMFPLNIELSASEYIILKENFALLRQMNFDIEEFGINSVIIKAHPLWLPKGHEDEAIKKIIDLVINKEKNFNLQKFNDNVAATVACKLSIKANQNISLSEMENLINDLRKCHNPFNCPHGRPTIIHYSKYELEKEFKRVSV